jgi:hypothetical protein
MNRDQVLKELSDKLRELDLDPGLVGFICINDMQGGTKVAGFNSKTSFYAIQAAMVVLDIAASVKRKVGQL